MKVILMMFSTEFGPHMRQVYWIAAVHSCGWPQCDLYCSSDSESHLCLYQCVWEDWASAGNNNMETYKQDSWKKGFGCWLMTWMNGGICCPLLIPGSHVGHVWPCEPEAGVWRLCECRHQWKHQWAVDHLIVLSDLVSIDYEVHEESLFGL